MTIATLLRASIRLSLFVLAWPLLAHANLPSSSNVPGGIAIIPLGSVSASAPPPLAWLGDQPVLVTADHDHWYAVEHHRR